MQENGLLPVEVIDKLKQALEFFNSLKSVSFRTQEEYDRGTELVKTVKSHYKIIEEDRKSLVAPYNNKVSEINKTCKDVLDKLSNAEKVIKSGMNKYYQDKERERLEQQRKLEAEAEQKRKEEADKARIEQEKADAHREQGREDLALKHEAKAYTAEDKSETIVAPIVEMPKTKGVSFRDDYSVTISDMKLAIANCIENPMLKEFVILDMKGLNRLAKALKSNFPVCPGLRVVKSTSSVIRT